MVGGKNQGRVLTIALNIMSYFRNHQPHDNQKPDLGYQSLKCVTVRPITSRETTMYQEDNKIVYYHSQKCSNKLTEA
jgi:hypothetical protein